MRRLKLFELIFGCRHPRTGFPLSSTEVEAAKLTGKYVACLDCGREFPYDWQEMKVITDWAPSVQPRLELLAIGQEERTTRWR